jgi:hypothetical protein
MPVVHAENLMGTNDQAQTAAYTFFFIELKGHDVREVD